MKRTFHPHLRALTLSIVLFFLVLLSFSASYAVVVPMKTVIDRNGRTELVPVDPRRIACFFGPSYEKVFLLGSADRVAAMSLKQSPWAHKLNPDLKKVAVMPSYTDPDVERLLQMGVDLVFYWQWPQQTRRMASAGIPVVCPYDGVRNPGSSSEFMRGYKDEIRFYGQVLGEKARKIAEDYCSYYDRKMRRIVSITSKIPEKRRPTVYYITGRNVFATQGGAGTSRWLLEMAGARMVSRDQNRNFLDVTMEQVIAWDPEVILVGGLTSPDAIRNDPRWKTIRAVRENRVYTCPEGVFIWGHGSSEGHLFVLWLAKILHPDRFKSFDLIGETREYFSRFYHYPLTVDEAGRILKRLPPEKG
jgi:iron complex transport system substrate-binding protein